MRSQKIRIGECVRDKHGTLLLSYVLKRIYFYIPLTLLCRCFCVYIDVQMQAFVPIVTLWKCVIAPRFIDCDWTLLINYGTFGSLYDMESMKQM